MEKLIGEVTHYFDHIGVAVIKITDGELKVGDNIHLVGHGADFTQIVDSMQVDHENVEKLKKGKEAGMKVADKAKPGVKVYLVKE
jgi:translation initiation factor IF-2